MRIRSMMVIASLALASLLMAGCEPGTNPNAPKELSGTPTTNKPTDAAGGGGDAAVGNKAKPTAAPMDVGVNPGYSGPSAGSKAK